MTKQRGLRVLCGTTCCPPYSSARLVSPIAQAGVEETAQWWVLGWILIWSCPSKLWRYSDISFWPPQTQRQLCFLFIPYIITLEGFGSLKLGVLVRW